MAQLVHPCSKDSLQTPGRLRQWDTGMHPLLWKKFSTFWALLNFTGSSALYCLLSQPWLRKPPPSSSGPPKQMSPFQSLRGASLQFQSYFCLIQSSLQRWVLKGYCLSSHLTTSSICAPLNWDGCPVGTVWRAKVKRSTQATFCPCFQTHPSTSKVAWFTPCWSSRYNMDPGFH